MKRSFWLQSIRQSKYQRSSFNSFISNISTSFFFVYTISVFVKAATMISSIQRQRKIPLSLFIKQQISETNVSKPYSLSIGTMILYYYFEVLYKLYKAFFRRQTYSISSSKLCGYCIQIMTLLKTSMLRYVATISKIFTSKLYIAMNIQITLRVDKYTTIEYKR